MSHHVTVAMHPTLHRQPQQQQFPMRDPSNDRSKHHHNAALHRAIYDYFRKLAKSSSNSSSSNDPMRFTGGQNSNHRHQQHDGAASVVPLNYGHPFFGRPFAFHDTTTPPTPTRNNLRDKAQRIVDVFEQEFPDILQLPGETFNDDDPFMETELERRFHMNASPPHHRHGHDPMQQQHQHQQQQPRQASPTGMAHHQHQHHLHADAALQSLLGRRRRPTHDGDDGDTSRPTNPYMDDDTAQPNQPQPTAMTMDGRSDFAPLHQHHRHGNRSPHTLPDRQRTPQAGNLSSLKHPPPHNNHMMNHNGQHPPPHSPATLKMPPPPPRRSRGAPLSHPANRVDTSSDDAPAPPTAIMPAADNTATTTNNADNNTTTADLANTYMPTAQHQGEEGRIPPSNDKKRKLSRRGQEEDDNDATMQPAATAPATEPATTNTDDKTDDKKELTNHEVELQKVKSQLRSAKKRIKKLNHKVKVNIHNQHEEQQQQAKRKRRKKTHDSGAIGIPTTSTGTTTFDQRFQELLHFQKGYGHCRVPCTSKENPGLARWVQTMRAAYKEKQKRGSNNNSSTANKTYGGQLTDERQAQLEAIGFEWSIQARPKATWEQRFADLQAFKAEHGHCRVVRSYPKDPSLGEWCHRQRFLAHKNELEQHKIKLLTDLGFEIWVRNKGKSWDDHFEMLLEFRRKHQHLRVPPPDTRTKVKQVLNASAAKGKEGDDAAAASTDATDTQQEGAAGGAGEGGSTNAAEEYKEEQAFRRWVAVQRDNYHLKYLKGVTSSLTKPRVKKLSGIGFDWTREGGENDLRKLRRGEFHHRNDPEIWNRRFQELVEYKKHHGDCNCPKEWPENKSLGAWVATQRKNYKAMIAGERSSLTNDRRMALEKIGFTWIVRPARTRQKILEIEGLQNMAPEML